MENGFVNRIIRSFRLHDEKEDYDAVIESIDRGVIFKGTNLWVLVFAIFIASLGLNINSPAVIIGAMLVSPLMGPIMGLGIGMAINDLALLRKALFNYLFAAIVGLSASTIYFLLTPINDAHSEILARTSPNIYDVLIALFGGFAGILATASRQKGNVIPGVAIATALMPPLCTAGFGLATRNFEFFFGAFYLFLINSVFIAWATLITARLLKFPLKHLRELKDEVHAKRIVWIVVLGTALPSVYFGFDIVQQNKFQKSANNFIENAAVFPNDYLLKKNIDARKKIITLIYGGQFIEAGEIEGLKSKMLKFGLKEATLEVKQGFAYLNENNGTGSDEATEAFNENEKQVLLLKARLDSLTKQNEISRQIFEELRVQYPSLKSCILQRVTSVSDSGQRQTPIAVLSFSSEPDKREKAKIEKWLKLRTQSKVIKTYFEK